MLGKSLQRVTLSQYVSYLPFKQDIFVTWIKFRFIGDLGIDVSFSIDTSSVTRFFWLWATFKAFGNN